MIKYASNAFLAAKISFINEIANVCEEVGADVSVVTEGMGLDSRIGPHFLRPGIGYGGSCFPKDVRALKQLAGNTGYHFQLLTAVIEVNELQKRRVVGKLERHLGALRGKRVAVLGLAFKANTDDMREAASLVLCDRLRAEGATVVVYDPVALSNAERLLAADVQRATSMLEAVSGADAAVIVTEWDEFRGARGARGARGHGQPVDRRRPKPARPRRDARRRIHLRVRRPAQRPAGAGSGRHGAGWRGLRMIAVILVGGLGTRLRPLTLTVPKPMLPIANRPFLEHQLEHLAAHGIDRVILACGYEPASLREHFGDRVEYVVEDHPLGTAGAIALAARGIDQTFVACNGDVLTDLDLTALVAIHRAAGARATIALHTVEDPSRYGVVGDGAGRQRRGVRREAGRRTAGLHHQRGHLRTGARRAGRGAGGRGVLDRARGVPAAGGRRALRRQFRCRMDRHRHAGRVSSG